MFEFTPRKITLWAALAPALVWLAGCSPDSSAQRPVGSTEPAAAAGSQPMDHTRMHEGQPARPAGETSPAVTENVKPYPLSTCVVSGEKLGEMGAPQRLVYQGQEMKFCCKDCVKDFQADPDKFMAKLAEAARAGAAQPMAMPGGEHDQSEHQHEH